MDNIQRGMVFSLMLILSAILVLADNPIGPQQLNWTSSRFNESTWGSWQVPAIAGNITEIMIDGWSLTRTWAGFYGNVTGWIVLSDTNNYTMYDWRDTDPDGEVYATRNNTPINWPSVRCATWDTILAEERFAGTNETNEYGKYPEDRVNNTFFNGTVNPNSGEVDQHPTFYVGATEITENTCYRVNLHNGSGIKWAQGNTTQTSHDEERWHEVMLADNLGDGNSIYVAILEHNYRGFDNRTHDFQLMLPEDGHGTDTAITNYYFYVQIV